MSFLVDLEIPCQEQRPKGRIEIKQTKKQNSCNGDSTIAAPTVVLAFESLADVLRSFAYFVETLTSAPFSKQNAIEHVSCFSVHQEIER